MINKVSAHIFVAVVVLFILFGCDKAPTKQESKPIKAPSQQVKNWDEEDISLISIKYKVDVKVVEKIIDEYEEMTGTGCHLFVGESDTILSVQEAIKELSQKYKIQENILASILIDKKSMESHEN
ncbi:MAG: hypothetical protein V1709_06620 [Planctomycetota bacterium]